MEVNNRKPRKSIFDDFAGNNELSLEILVELSERINSKDKIIKISTTQALKELKIKFPKLKKMVTSSFINHLEKKELIKTKKRKTTKEKQQIQSEADELNENIDNKIDDIVSEYIKEYVEEWENDGFQDLIDKRINIESQKAIEKLSVSELDVKAIIFDKLKTESNNKEIIGLLKSLDFKELSYICRILVKDIPDLKENLTTYLKDLKSNR